MLKLTFASLALVASSIAWSVPVEYVEERHVVEISKRQQDLSQLLQLYVSLCLPFNKYMPH